MEKFNDYEVGTDKKLENNSGIKLTGKVLRKLTLWGVIALSPLGGSELKNQNMSVDDISTPVTMFEKVGLFEKRFENDGLLNTEENKGKPVVVVTTRDDIEVNYFDKNGPIKTNRSLVSEEIKLNFVEDGEFDVVERDSSVMKAIFDEVRMSEEGLINQKETIKLGNWGKSDYYVVNSVKTDGPKYIIENEILNMKDGSSTVVVVETLDKNSDDAIKELFEKTKKIIEDISLNSKNG